jgi:hypothetical protein
MMGTALRRFTFTTHITSSVGPAPAFSTSARSGAAGSRGSFGREAIDQPGAAGRDQVFLRTAF